jgi:hypothetical protein
MIVGAISELQRGFIGQVGILLRRFDDILAASGEGAVT